MVFEVLASITDWDEILKHLSEVGYSWGFLSNLQVKQESLGIPTKMFLKVDVESGKLYFKKSKDGPEEKCFGHNKSKTEIMELY